jgi:hypothetical protein
LLTLALRDKIGWRGIWIIVRIGALIIFILRFSCRNRRAGWRHTATVDLLQRMGLRTVPLETLSIDAASQDMIRPEPLTSGQRSGGAASTPVREPLSPLRHYEPPRATAKSRH